MAIKLFSTDYSFKGSQCDKVLALTEKIDSSGASIFSSAVELFIFASLIGCYYNRRAKPEKDQKMTKILASQFYNHSSDIESAYKFVLLTSSRENNDDVARLNRTFRNRETEENEKLFEEFMLGGVEELYDRLFVSSNRNFSDYLTTLNQLLATIKQDDDIEEMVDLIDQSDLF